MTDVIETNNETTQAQPEAKSSGALKLNGIFAKKLGMSSVFLENGLLVPVTVLQAKPLFVTQIKTVDKDGYTAVQLSSFGKRMDNSSKASQGHLAKATKQDTAASVIKEIRQDLPENVQLGQEVSLESFAKGDIVKVTSKSKGHGFTGSVKRWNFDGGPATHGSHFHRQPGSSGNRTWPARVMPGKKFPGHYGDETTTLINVEVIQVIPEDGLILVKGPVPGGRNTLVKLMRQ